MTKRLGFARVTEKKTINSKEEKKCFKKVLTDEKSFDVEKEKETRRSPV